jgi:RNA polymerase-binding protein DksA
MKSKSRSSGQARLLQERREVLAELDYLREEMQSEVDFEPDEGDIQITEHETAAILLAILKQRLLDIESALAALASGQYSRCERCGKEIEPERLAAKPDARYCLDCQLIVEKVMHQYQSQLTVA